ncbi:MAG: nucleoside monophosphate kinase [bacterium]
MFSNEGVPITETGESLKLGKLIVGFIGPEGSGKTTMATKLSEVSGKPYISTGDIVRNLAQNDSTKYGNACRDILEGGKYLNPNMLLELLETRLNQTDTEEGFILDGVFRSIEEIQGFQSMLDRIGRTMPIVTIQLRIPGWMGVYRLAQKEGARKREGDTIDGVLKRLSKYYHQVGQRASLIRNQEGWQLVHIDSTGTQEELFNNVLIALHEYKSRP